MLNLFTKQDPYREPARLLYAHALKCLRDPWFYRQAAIPDTFDCRFDLLVLQLFFVMDRLSGAGKAGRMLNQTLFDVAFADMDQTLREQGAGDMSVPKHMRRMMTAFNGRIHAYHVAFEQGGQAIEDALIRNIYKTTPDPQAVACLAEYAKASHHMFAQTDIENIFSGRQNFYNPELMKTAA
jgi:cytochrome b pre-mRNA-processing protein 3